MFPRNRTTLAHESRAKALKWWRQENTILLTWFRRETASNLCGWLFFEMANFLIAKYVFFGNKHIRHKDKPVPNFEFSPWKAREKDDIIGTTTKSIDVEGLFRITQDQIAAICKHIKVSAVHVPYYIIMLLKQLIGGGSDLSRSINIHIQIWNAEIIHANC